MYVCEETGTMSEKRIPKISLKIVSQKGTCVFNHKVGQEFDVSASTPAGLCPSAYNAALPTIFALRVGGQIPWAKEDGSVHIACPDPENPLVIAIKRES
jgi:uncharacterized repeat protein (TIGR04076 family)